MTEIAPLRAKHNSRIYKDYEDCLMNAICISRLLTLENQIKLRHAISVCDSLDEEAEKKFRLVTTLLNTLWDIPEAVNKGFHVYLREQQEYNRLMLGYHKKNCESHCNICSFLKERVDFLC